MEGAENRRVSMRFHRTVLRATRNAARTAARYIEYVLEFRRFKQLVKSDRFRPNWSDRYPCLADKTASTEFDRHYVLHTAWAARVLARTRPPYHVDVSSSLYFAGILSAFVPVQFFDYRPVELGLSGLTVGRADLLELPFDDNSVRSLSCMHVVEHVGLGRYGDKLDPDGDLSATAELRRVLARGGDLLFVVPIGKSRIQFNAHRIYSYEQVVNCFRDLSLVEFALIPDYGKDGHLVYQAEPEMANSQNYGCGCFWFRKMKED